MRLSILPLVQILSGLPVHVALIFLAIMLCWGNGYAPSFYTAQIFYYMSCLVFLLLGLGWLTSSTNVFVSDVSKVVQIIVQFGFWGTPIFWNIGMIPEQYQWIIKLNPMFYITSGYRDSLLYGIAFWNRPVEMIYFWAVTVVILAGGVVVFKRLRPHFAEVI